MIKVSYNKETKRFSVEKQWSVIKSTSGKFIAVEYPSLKYDRGLRKSRKRFDTKQDAQEYADYYNKPENNNKVAFY